MRVPFTVFLTFRNVENVKRLFINPIRIIRKIISIEETKEMMYEILETFPGKI